ncbi:MAG: 2-oxoglutarate dehydrogenase E1 component [Planctomycetota bacterium]
MPAPDADPPVNAASLEYVEALFDRYLEDPQSVDAQWRPMFDQWAADNGRPGVDRVGPGFARRSIFHSQPAAANGHAPVDANVYPTHPADRDDAPHHPRYSDQDARVSPPAAIAAPLDPADAAGRQFRVDQLIRNYRVRGHIIAQVDPLGRRLEQLAELDPAYYGFTDEDLDRPFVTSNFSGRSLREIIAALQETYCGDIAFQFMHIDNLQVREWLQRRIERAENRTQLSLKEQVRILTRLTDAVIFEQFIQKKFIGAKSFSLEGAESLIPLLDLALETAGDQGVKEVVIGMAHRGRLNVLANIIGKPAQQVFREFEDVDARRYLGGGDVKYHLGYSGDWHTRHGQNVHLSLCFNPSHLEYVNPVALGRLRAKQDRTGKDTRGDQSMGLIIHGDAAFAGEGVVQETLNLSLLDGYATGGTLHVVINNQIGFTTAPREGRSCRYATDVAKMLQIPIFHVNGENPEAVARAIRLAMEFRATFKRDAVVDMYCYRLRGHNESDEPSYTQPEMYDAIAQRPGVREGYLSHLLKLGGLTADDADRIAKRRTELLERELTAARSDDFVPAPARKLEGPWKDLTGGPENRVDDTPTGVDRDKLTALLAKTIETPEHFAPHPKLRRQFKARTKMAAGEQPLDWSAAEALAFATLAVEGHPIRVSGQDSQRGTFSHRHAVLHDHRTGDILTPLKHLDPNQAPVDFYNSPLSEAGVLGFDYGYSLDYPEALVIWEAQFGDFANAAQVIIDQFIVSAEDKWSRLSGLVLLLPHGFEGQGPEHSSARLERFLNMCTEDNIQVCNPTTPAQMFHLLRRQVARRWRKPLVVMTPKSLLRHPGCVSPLDDLASGKFQRLIPDPQSEERDRVSRVLLCSGKIYYELLAARTDLHRDKDVDIIRLEQYYPFPEQSLRKTLSRYPDDTPVFWVQEEPENMGAWPFLKMMFCHRLFDRLTLHAVCRPPSASPATGSKAAHAIEQEQVIAEAFGGH